MKKNGDEDRPGSKHGDEDWGARAGMKFGRGARTGMKKEEQGRRMKKKGVGDEKERDGGWSSHVVFSHIYIHC